MHYFLSEFLFSVPSYRVRWGAYLCRQMRKRVQTCCTQYAGDSFRSDSSDNSSTADTPHVVGTVMLSFNERSREAFMMLTPPSQSILLTNMAVDKRFQRNGIATQLLEACVEYCARHRSERQICLHVRWKDDPANQLYMCALIQWAVWRALLKHTIAVP